MRRNLKTVIAASALVGGLLAAPALYAHTPGGSQGGMMGGMMQGGPMMGGGMMGMMGMGMMEQMSQMMATCNEMMQAHMQDHGPHDPNGRGMMPQREGVPPLPEERPSAAEQRG